MLDEPWMVWWLLYEVEPAQKALQEPLINHRSIQHVRASGPDRSRLNCSHNLRLELVVDAAMYPNRAERRASLSGGAVSTEERPFNGEVDLGVRHDHHRILSTQFQTRRLQVPTAQLTD